MLDFKGLKQEVEKQLGEEVTILTNNTYTNYNAILLDVFTINKRGKIVVGENEQTYEVFLLAFESEQLRFAVKENIKLFIEKEEKKKVNVELKDGLDLSIDYLNLAPRSRRCLNGYMDAPVRDTLGEIISASEDELLTQHNQLGKKGLQNIVEIVNGLGYELKK